MLCGCFRAFVPSFHVIALLFGDSKKRIEALHKILKSCNTSDRLVIEADMEDEEVSKKTMRIT